nr:hypothetical protein HmN_000326700 [Hymenolepis microstoma]
MCTSADKGGQWKRCTSSSMGHYPPWLIWPTEDVKNVLLKAIFPLDNSSVASAFLNILWKMIWRLNKKSRSRNLNNSIRGAQSF